VAQGLSLLLRLSSRRLLPASNPMWTGLGQGWPQDRIELIDGDAR
jgi:hypothetical protein